MDTTNASSTDEDLRIDWGEAVVGDDGDPTELALSVPPDLFGSGDVPDPQFLDGLSSRPEEPEDPSALVIEDLFADAPAPGPADDATLVVEDLFAPSATTATAPAPATASATAVTPPDRPRLAPKRRQGQPRRRRFHARKLLIPAAVAAAIVGLATVLDQPPDPSVDVRSAAPAEPAPSVTVSTRPLPTTTAAPASTTTVDTSPSTTTAGGGSPAAAGGGGSPATTAGAAAATRAPVPTAAPRATVAPSPVTTAAPAPVTPTSTAASVPELVITEPATTETTARPRRPRETVPPRPSTPPSTDTSVASDDVVEID